MPTQTRMKILDLVPLDTEISRYEHFLPCCFQDGSGNGIFMIQEINNIYCFDALQLFSHYCAIQQHKRYRLKRLSMK